ncbi:MAG: PAS domain S-box protein, partial [Bacteroidetes bacterium]|nr:PAS domain S-box protein [Bacteroidota bacterium]
ELNTSAEKLFLYSRKELIGKHIEKLVPVRFRQVHKTQHESFLLQPKVRPMGSGLQLYALKKNGDECPVEISLNPILLGKRSEVAAIIRDISEKKEIENRLRSSERKYRFIFNENPYPIFIYDTGTLKILEVNEAAIAKYKFSREELMRMSIDEILVGASRVKPHDQTAEGGKRRFGEYLENEDKGWPYTDRRSPDHFCRPLRQACTRVAHQRHYRNRPPAGTTDGTTKFETKANYGGHVPGPGGRKGAYRGRIA